MVQVNRVCLKILFINRPQFLVDSNDIFLRNNLPSLMSLGDFDQLRSPCSHPLIDGDAADTTVSGSLRYRECLIGLSVSIETSHARLVSPLTHQVSLRSI